MVAVRVEDTPIVLMLNDAIVWPAGTVTPVTGTITTGSLLRSVKLAPPGGAGTAMVTVPVTVAPPATVFMLSAIATGGLMVRRADCVVPLRVAVIVAACGLVTAEVAMLNVKDLCAASTVTLAGG